MASNGGRPPTPGLSEAFLQAAERVMVVDGFGSLTVDRLITEIGTTRPTFYRRYPNVASLAFEVIRGRFGVGTQIDTGSLRGDLVALQREDVAMFSSPLIRNNLPGLLESVRTDPTVRERYRNGFVGPRRANVRDVVTAATHRGELAGEVVDTEFVCDLLLGPILTRTLLPVTGALDDQLARESALTAFNYLVNVAAGYALDGQKLPSGA